MEVVEVGIILIVGSDLRITLGLVKITDVEGTGALYKTLLNKLIQSHCR